MIKLSIQQMITIFLFFLFGSVMIDSLLRKINQIERSSNRVSFRERPEFIFYNDMPYRYPRRSIDINLPQINVSAPPTTAPTTAPDTSGDEALARSIARSLDGEIGTEEFHRRRRESRDESGSDDATATSDGGPEIVGGIRRKRRDREGFTNNIEGYSGSSSLMGSPF